MRVPDDADGLKGIKVRINSLECPGVGSSRSRWCRYCILAFAITHRLLTLRNNNRAVSVSPPGPGRGQTEKRTVKKSSFRTVKGRLLDSLLYFNIRINIYDPASKYEEF